MEGGERRSGGGRCGEGAGKVGKVGGGSGSLLELSCDRCTSRCVEVNEAVASLISSVPCPES